MSLSVTRQTSSIWLEVCGLIKVTSMVYQLQPQCSRNFRTNKRRFIHPNYFERQTIIQPIHVSKNIVEWFHWVAAEKDCEWVCQMTRLRGIAATDDALLLLLQIRVTKHGLWLHTVWTAQTHSTGLLKWLFYSSPFQQGEFVGVQRQEWRSQL